VRLPGDTGLIEDNKFCRVWRIRFKLEPKIKGIGNGDEGKSLPGQPRVEQSDILIVNEPIRVLNPNHPVVEAETFNLVSCPFRRSHVFRRGYIYGKWKGGVCFDVGSSPLNHTQLWLANLSVEQVHHVPSKHKQDNDPLTDRRSWR
jgi:hypothetical protein